MIIIDKNDFISSIANFEILPLIELRRVQSLNLGDT